jgi:hypothetical protein
MRPSFEIFAKYLQWKLGDGPRFKKKVTKTTKGKIRSFDFFCFTKIRKLTPSGPSFFLAKISPKRGRIILFTSND